MTPVAFRIANPSHRLFDSSAVCSSVFVVPFVRFFFLETLTLISSHQLHNDSLHDSLEVHSQWTSLKHPIKLIKTEEFRQVLRLPIEQLRFNQKEFRVSFLSSSELTSYLFIAS